MLKRLRDKIIPTLVVAVLGVLAVVWVFSHGAPPPGSDTVFSNYDGLAIGLARTGILLVTEFVLLDEIVFRDVDTESFLQKHPRVFGWVLAGNAVAIAICLAG